MSVLEMPTTRIGPSATAAASHTTHTTHTSNAANAANRANSYGAEIIELFAVPEPVPRRPRPLGYLLVALGLAMIPWLFVLATSLPATAQASHWSTAWVGLDALEAIGLIGTGLLLRRRDARRGPAAAATAMLLVVDAWFDVTTAAPGADIASAIGMAVCAELPLAALCVVLAVRASAPH
ncbi:hypothetical protein QMK19_27130 [Streptomyces sp. H10-C2]|uniref:hypothetical protein n=1 Tax=unclassified Streptomyces TaxID=2593676 RepID=UPI0024B98F82|nr:MULTISPECIES: hypothetical protein [unclassified Streptomyces]MDJ0344612.1 hypothetical protein [Streptomyces sp. PH10-H1]MDJ0373228.1 hypothetical protein [Streptomyces sp. H10-C2]